MDFSVCMITYKHEPYISEAIEGVLMQEVNFEVELIIADDASPDNTEKIVKYYIENHPRGHWIKYYKNVNNLGVLSNFVFSLKKCYGKYIAICEGDDYWISSLKLQKQFDFLEKNIEISFCFHQAYKVKGTNIAEIYPLNVKKNKLSITEFFEIGGNATSSIAFRNYLPTALLDLDHIHCDFLLYISLFERGDAGFINLPMSIYRIHVGGISFQKGSFSYSKRRLKELKIEAKYFTNSNIQKEIEKQYIKHLYLFFKNYKQNLSSKEYLRFLFELTKSPYFYLYYYDQKIDLVKRRLFLKHEKT